MQIRFIPVICFKRTLVEHGRNMSQSIQNLWKWLLETVFVLALVLVSFLTLLAVLNIFFPSGQSLFQLIQGVDGKTATQAPHAQDGRHVRVGIADRESDLGSITTATATLTMVTNNVKSRRSAQIAWEDAASGMTLFDHDAVQTGRRSTARLSFGPNSYLDMKENSLLIIRSLERDVFLNSGRTVAVLVEGQFEGEIGKPREGSFNVDLVAAGAVARVEAPGDTDQPSSFKMIVNSDESSVLTVFQGKADLMFQGNALEVRTNQIVKMQPGMEPVFLPPPPAPPVAILPQDGEIIAYRDTPPKVTFAWKGPEDNLRYRFVLARDSRFENIVYEQITSRTSFTHGNLKPDEYYWRVSSLGPEEEGGYSKTCRLLMVQDLEPPALRVSMPEGPLGKGSLVLKGTTDPGAELFLNGMSKAVDEDGRFEVTVELKGGWNILVFEAVDHVGNVAYFSSTLNVQ